MGDATLLTTIQGGLTDGEAWCQIGDDDPGCGTLLMLSGDIVLSRTIVAPGL
jgi:hypothetical protein